MQTLTVLILIACGAACLVRAYVASVWFGWDTREGIPLRLLRRRGLSIAGLGLLSLATGVYFQIMKAADAVTPAVAYLFAALAMLSVIATVAVWRWSFDYRRFTPFVKNNKKPI